MSSELNLDFDPDKKNITMSNATTDNLGFNTETSNMKIEEINTDPTISPNLKTADPIGVELLAKGVVSPVNSNNSSPRNDSVKSEEFSFLNHQKIRVVLLMEIYQKMIKMLILMHLIYRMKIQCL